MTLEKIIEEAVEKVDDAKVMLAGPMQGWNHG